MRLGPLRLLGFHGSPRLIDLLRESTFPGGFLWSESLGSPHAKDCPHVAGDLHGTVPLSQLAPDPHFASSFDSLRHDLDGLLGRKAVPDSEMRVQVVPLGGDPLELAPELADEHIDRAVSGHERVAPYAGVDIVALEDHARGGGE